jgi:phage-related protein
MATIAEMMVRIGADVSDLQKSTKQVQTDFKKMGSNVNGIAKDVGQSVQGLSGKWKLMSDEMKSAYTQAQASLNPFKNDMVEVEYGFFKLGKSMNDYKGTNKEFMSEVEELGKRHKKVTENMVKNNDFMKQSFIQGVGQMLARSGQSDKIAANFERMGNPLYSVNNGLLKIGSSLEGVARQGTATVLALKQLGPNANMKDLLDMTRMINLGLLRTASLALIAGIAFIGMNVGLAKMAEANGFNELSSSLSALGSTLNTALLPFIESWDKVMGGIVDGINAVAGLWAKFSQLNPELSAAVTWFAYLFVGLLVLLAPLAVGIGLTGGLTAAFSALWLVISPFVIGFLTVAATAAVVAAAIVAVGGALYLLWTKTTWFKDAVLSVWEGIKQATLTAWNFIYNNAIKPAIDAIYKFIQSKMAQVKSFWDQNGQQILQAGKNVWSVISKVVEVAVTAIGAILQVVFPVAKALVISTWNAIKMTISGAIDIILGVIKFFAALFTGDWRGVWEACKQILSGAVQFILGFVQITFIGGITRGISAFASTLKTLFTGIWNTAKSIFSTGINGVKTVVTSGFDNVVSFITGLGSTFFNAGKGLIDMMAQGIKSAAGKVLSEMKEIASKARDFLPFSPAKTGPLSDLDKLDFAGPIGDSITRGIPVVKSLMSDILQLPEIKASDNGSSAFSSSSQSQSNTYVIENVTIDAKNVREINDIVALFNRQAIRQF